MSICFKSEWRSFTVRYCYTEEPRRTRSPHVHNPEGAGLDCSATLSAQINQRRGCAVNVYSEQHFALKFTPYCLDWQFVIRTNLQQDTQPIRQPTPISSIAVHHNTSSDVLASSPSVQSGIRNAPFPIFQFYSGICGSVAQLR